MVERALSAGTVRGYVDHARKFLVGLPPGSAVGEVTAADVTTALRRVADAVSVAAVQTFRAGQEGTAHPASGSFRAILSLVAFPLFSAVLARFRCMT